jgi:DNA-binding beta-propeller fold protein YncE
LSSKSTIDIDYGPWDICYDSPLNLQVLNKLSVINTDNNVIEQEISVGKGPTNIVYDQIHQRIYVIIFGSEDPGGSKNEIDIISV